MFSFGQLIFGTLFFIAFVGVIIYSYRSDKKKLPNYFKGSYKVLVGFLIAFCFLVLVKYLTQR
jgi:amino acid transporter